MNRRAAGICFCAFALIAFLSRYVFAIWYRGAKSGQSGPEDFARNLASVGLVPWVVAGACLLAGIAFLATAEKDL